jgi:oligopeptide/dipeptide ABC transporter ATP-binding protein
LSEVILQVKDLVVSFDTEWGAVRAVDGLSFDVRKGETLGVVGESGCGKSVTCLALMRLLPQPIGHIASGQILLGDKDLAQLPREMLRTIRGRRIAMIFQEPMTALNPVETVGDQILEVFELHFPEVPAAQAHSQAIDLLRMVGISAPEQRMDSYPHQLSGGMRQRVMIAMALACKPDILIADEPTTALDVTIQAQILDLLRVIQKKTGMAMIFITHDLGVVAEMCDHVLVMYGGRAVESGTAEAVFKSPSHPYTKGLLASLPRFDSQPKALLKTIPGMVPSLQNMPVGCRFASRCEFAKDVCLERQPGASMIGSSDHLAWCVRLAEIGGARDQSVS